MLASDWPWQCLLPVLLALGSGWVLTDLAGRVARRMGLLDRPDEARKAHSVATPLMGGVAVYLSFSLSLLVALLAGFDWLSESARVAALVPRLILFAGLFCLLGLWDDKFGMRAGQKFALQLAIAVPFAVWQSPLSRLGFLGITAELGFWAVPISVLWLLVCVNVINLVDGLDGLAGSMALIVSLTLGFLGFWGNPAGLAVVALVFAGSLTGFLRHNWPPATIFLGDAGSLMIGFLLGALSLETAQKTAAGLTLSVPVILLSIPLFDTLMAIARRKLRGQSIGQADRGHLHHSFLERGYSRRESLLAILALSGLMAIAAIASVWLQNDLIGVGLCLAVLGALIAARIFGYEETVLLAKHMQVLGALLAETSQMLRTKVWLLRLQDDSAGGDPQATREAIGKQIERMGVSSLKFFRQDEQSNALLHRMSWPDGEEAKSAHNDTWELKFSICGDQERESVVAVSGYCRDAGQGPRIDELLRLIEAYCEQGTLETPSGEVNSRPRRFLTAHQPTSRQKTISLAHRDEPQRAGTVEPEAA